MKQDKTKQVLSIQPEEYYQLYKKNQKLPLIDVRNPDEFKNIRAEMAQLIPLDKFMAEDPKTFMASYSQEAPLYIICRSGARSYKAAEILVQAGFREVYNVEGGTLAWDADGLPTAKG